MRQLSPQGSADEGGASRLLGGAAPRPKVVDAMRFEPSLPVPPAFGDDVEDLLGEQSLTRLQIAAIAFGIMVAGGQSKSPSVRCLTAYLIFEG
jgi:hypothetical protein